MQRNRGGAPPRQGRRFRAEHRGGGREPRRTTTEVRPKVSCGAPRRGRRFRAEHRGEAKEDHRGDTEEPRRTTTEGEADEEWEHCRGQHRGMRALRRPTPRNHQGRGRRQGMGAPRARPTPRKEWEHRPAPRNWSRNKGGAQHRGTPQTDGASGNQQPTRNGVTERKKRLVEAAGTQTMSMAKQNEAN